MVIDHDRKPLLSGPDKIREALQEVVDAYLQVDEGRFNWEDWYDRAAAALNPESLPQSAGIEERKPL